MPLFSLLSKILDFNRNRFARQLLNALDKEVLEIRKDANRIGAPRSWGDYGLEESKSDLASLIRSRGEVKGMFSAEGPTGGWTVAPVLQDGIGTIVRDNSALRELVNFIPIDSGDAYEELI
ncbi:MAG: hypothetical protein WAW61_05560, partial [Methylococcaceae bacterium]